MLGNLRRGLGGVGHRVFSAKSSERIDALNVSEGQETYVAVIEMLLPSKNEFSDVGRMMMLPAIPRDDVMKLVVDASQFRHLRALISIPTLHSLSFQLSPYRPNIGNKTSEDTPEVPISHASSENPRSRRGHPCEARGASVRWHSAVNRPSHQTLSVSRLSNSIQCFYKTCTEEEEGRLLWCWR